MSDYIKRENVLNAFSNAFYSGLAAKINEIPSEDVEPVRHGHWIEKAFRIMCSDCGAEFKDEILYMLGNDEQMSYCPNCGARIDGESDG